MIESELTHGGADDLREVRARSLQLSQVVRERSNVRARPAFHRKARGGSFHTREPEFVHFHLDGIELHRLVFSREFVRGTPVDFLRRKRRRHLLNFPDETVGERLNRLRIKRRRGIFAERVSIGVVCVRRESEAHRAGVSFSTAAVEAREPRGPPQSEHEHAGRQRIERAEMADLAKANHAAHGFHHVVRGFPAWLVNDKNSVNGRRLWGSRHFAS